MTEFDKLFEDFEDMLMEEFSEFELDELEASAFFGIINCCNTVAKPSKTTLG